MPPRKPEPPPNIDPITGIHYGCISQHSIDPDLLGYELWSGGTHAVCEWSDEDRILTPQERARIEKWWWRKIMVKVYPEKYTRRQRRNAARAEEYVRKICENAELRDDAEPVGWYYDDGEVRLVPCFDDTCFMVIKSPVVVHCRPCSPCAPNAGDLDNLDPGNLPTYGLPPEWLTEEAAAEVKACLELMGHLEDCEHGKGPNDPDCAECLAGVPNAV